MEAAKDCGLSNKQWYRILLEKGVTHISDDPSAPFKVELDHPEIDPSASYSSKFGVAPEKICSK
jgi:hypothetical protein